MSNDTHLSTGKQFPQIRIVTTGNKEILKQDYKPEVFVDCCPADNNPASQFNFNLHNYSGFIYGLLGPQDNFIDGGVVSKIVSIFNMYPMVNIVYSDLLLVHPNHSYIQFLPLSSPNIFNEQIINPPLFMRDTPNKLKFNEELDHLYFHDFLRRCVHNNYIYHMAETLFQRNIEQDIDFMPDIHKLNNNNNIA